MIEHRYVGQSYSFSTCGAANRWDGRKRRLSGAPRPGAYFAPGSVLFSSLSTNSRVTDVSAADAKPAEICALTWA
jgi:hypothetical protein